LSPLLARVPAASAQLRPAIRAGRELLVRGAPTLSRLNGGLRAVRAAAPDTSRLVDAVSTAMPAITEGFLVDFPDQAAEPGRQPLDLTADPRRAYWRGAAVFSCEAFGVPVAPGCLTRVLGTGKGKASQPAAPKQRKAPSVSDVVGGLLPPQKSGSPALGAPSPATPSVGGTVKQLLDFLLGR
jgi:hypothetical protein